MTNSSLSSRNSALAGFLFGAVCTIGVTKWWLSRQERRGNNHSSSSRPKTTSATTKTTTSTTTIPQELREEQLSRHTLYFGEEGMQKIQNSKICVVGLGGVGSHTAVMLARGGVEYMRLIDFDQVTLSSLNRHACATLQDVGIPKVTCVKEFCHRLGVSNIDARVEMYTKASGPALLEGQEWDLVIDCIDDVPTKAALLAYCLQHNIQVFSCMGAGGKSDITRLHISDLRTSSRDPLASKLRQTMKRTLKEFNAEVTAAATSSSPSYGGSNAAVIDDSYLDDMDRLTIIFSSEKCVIKLAHLTDEQKEESDKNQFGAVDGMRIRVLPVLGPIPAIMGQSLAAMALCEIGDKPMAQPVTGERVGRNTRNKMLQHLMRREEQIANGTLLTQYGGSVVQEDGDNATNVWTGPLEVDTDDMEYMLGVWRNRCAVTGARLGTVLDLVRWDLSKPTMCGNLVLMSTHALKKYDQEGRASIPLEIQRRIEKRLSTCRDLNSEIF